MFNRRSSVSRPLRPPFPARQSGGVADDLHIGPSRAGGGGEAVVGEVGLPALIRQLRGEPQVRRPRPLPRARWPAVRSSAAATAARTQPHPPPHTAASKRLGSAPATSGPQRSRLDLASDREETSPSWGRGVAPTTGHSDSARASKARLLRFRLWRSMMLRFRRVGRTQRGEQR
jgi:hypothetical protein